MSHHKAGAALITPHDYSNIFAGRQSAPAAFDGVCGRVLRVRAGERPGYLSLPRTRRLAWVVGPDGLASMVGRTGLTILLELGVLRARIEANLGDGMRWALAVLPAGDCTPATWDGVFTAVGRHFSPGVADRLRPHAPALQNRLSILGTDEAQRLGDPAVREHPEHPDHMTAERYLAAADTPANAWLFLWHSVGMNLQFDGSGYSRTADGAKGYGEYLVPNVRLTELRSDLALIEFDVAADARAAGWEVPTL